MSDRLSEIRARLDKATPGPWEFPIEKPTFGAEPMENCMCQHPDWETVGSSSDGTDEGTDKDGDHWHRHRQIDWHFIQSETEAITGNFDYEVGGVINRRDADLIAHAPDDLAWLLARVDRVLALHRPIDAAALSYGSRVVQVCAGCGQDDGNWAPWPCPTVRAITGGDLS